MNRKIEESEKLKKMLEHMYNRGFADGEAAAKGEISGGAMNPEKILRNLDDGCFTAHQEQAEAAAYIRQLQQAVLDVREACAQACEKLSKAN